MGSASSTTFGEENHLYGIEDDEEIEEQREILDVVEVILQLLECALDRRSVLVLYLGPAGDARLDGESFHVVRNLLLQRDHELRPLGARSDEAHVTHQHVEELRQLVQPRAAEQMADSREPRVLLDAPYRTPLLLGVLTHGAELVDYEEATALSEASLAVDGPPTGLALQRERRHPQR